MARVKRGSRQRLGIKKYLNKLRALGVLGAEHIR